MAETIDISSAQVDENISDVDEPSDQVDVVIVRVPEGLVYTDTNRDDKHGVKRDEDDEDLPDLLLPPILDYGEFPAVVLYFLVLVSLVLRVFKLLLLDHVSKFLRVNTLRHSGSIRLIGRVLVAAQIHLVLLHLLDFLLSSERLVLR